VCGGSSSSLLDASSYSTNGSNSEYLKHSQGRPAKENGRGNDNDEHRRTQRLCIASFEASREGNTDRTAETRPKKHHLVAMVKLFATLTMRMGLEEIDQLGEREDSGMACKDDCRVVPVVR
jgi:hypothetical protein